MSEHCAAQSTSCFERITSPSMTRISSRLDGQKGISGLRTEAQRRMELDRPHLPLHGGETERGRG